MWVTLELMIDKSIHLPSREGEDLNFLLFHYSTFKQNIITKVPKLPIDYKIVNTQHFVWDALWKARALQRLAEVCLWVWLQNEGPSNLVLTISGLHYSNSNRIHVRACVHTHDVSVPPTQGLQPLCTGSRRVQPPSITQLQFSPG